MKVTLLHHTPLEVCSKAIRTCWDSSGQSDTVPSAKMKDGIGVKDRELIERVGNKNKHKSVLEHISYNFYIEGLTRAALQELARHRIASLSVMSSRYTLKKAVKRVTKDNVHEYMKLTGNKDVDDANWEQLQRLFKIITEAGEDPVANDVLKYMLPESFYTNVAWSINARSLQNFLSLRSSRQALPEMQLLARLVYNELPNKHKYLFEESIEK